MTEPVFELHGVDFSYQGKFPALRGIDFQVMAGDRVALIGANGSGKSTLLHLLDALIFPDQGTVKAFGEPLGPETLDDETRSKTFRSRVGLVFQNADIQLFCPSVREDIAFGPLQLGVKDEEVWTRLEEAARVMEIQNLLDRVPHQLSIGEKRKVAIATVLAIDPDVMLFDEPTAGLDPLTVRHIVDLMVKAHQRGKTIITATHDLHIVAEIADTVHVFGRDKRIDRSGPTEVILNDRALLEEHNLVHIHGHWHGGHGHAHPHPPSEQHD